MNADFVLYKIVSISINSFYENAQHDWIDNWILADDKICVTRVIGVV